MAGKLERHDLSVPNRLTPWQPIQSSKRNLSLQHFHHAENGISNWLVKPDPGNTVCDNQHIGHCRYKQAGGGNKTYPRREATAHFTLPLLHPMDARNVLGLCPLARVVPVLFSTITPCPQVPGCILHCGSISRKKLV
ncbi:MAG: hypothetical protein ACFHX7_05110 [Pseudomonadota bacterium]